MISEAQVFNSNAVDLISHGDLNGSMAALSISLSKLSWCVLDPNPIRVTTDSCEFLDQNSTIPTVQITAYPNSSSIVTASRFASKKIGRSILQQSLDEWHGWSVRDPKNVIFPHPFSYDTNVSYNFEKVNQQEPNGLSQGPFKRGKVTAETNGFLGDVTIITTSQYNCCQIVSLFNLSLTYHLEWMRQQNLASTMDTTEKVWLLNKAVAGYESLYQVAATQECPFMSTVGYPLIGVIMAACTNASQACEELLQFEMSYLWNRRLVVFLKLSHLPKERTSPVAQGDTFPSVPPCHNSFFVLNATIGSIRREAAQAA